MNKEQLLQILKEQATRIFEANIPEVALVKELVGKIRAVTPADRDFFQPFVKEIGDKLFEKSIEIPGLFSGIISQAKTSKDKTLTKSESIELSFLESVRKLIGSVSEELINLKLYYFLRLQSFSSTSADFQVVLLYESDCYYHPIKKKLKAAYPNLVFKEVSDFASEIASSGLNNSHYLILLLLSPKANASDELSSLIQSVKSIIDRFDVFEHFVITDLAAITADTIKGNADKEKFLDEIDYTTSVSLSNIELSNEDEKIIKKFFKGINCSLLEYKILKGGKSGSKVLEVRPKTEYGTTHSKRYVLKFCVLDERRKISSESKRFKAHIDPFSINDYNHEYKRTLSYEGIRYSYASGGSINLSHSLSEILSNPNNPYHATRRDILNSLFEKKPFSIWDDSTEETTQAIRTVYKDYINEVKIFESIKKILNVTDAELTELPLIENFTKIFNRELKLTTKVCHGDLHSENIFFDNEGAYLIDFGFTDKRHSIIDHAALECSIKFKHIPLYIEISHLEAIEKELLTNDTFLSSYSFASPRSDLKEFYEAIRDIRTNAIKKISQPKPELQYQIGLFVMTFRQIQYSDLNQAYALRAAEILGASIARQL